MTWLGWLALAVVITAVAAITGIKPKGTRHVAHTSMMGVARITLLIIGVIVRPDGDTRAVRRLTLAGREPQRVRATAARRA